MDWCWLRGFVAKSPGLANLRTRETNSFLKAPFPAGTLVHAYGADANIDGNGRIDFSECGLTPPPFIADLMCKILGSAQTITSTVVDNPTPPWVVVQFTAIELTPQPFCLDDIAVTVESAQPPPEPGDCPGTRDAIHTRFLCAALASEIKARIMAEFPVNVQAL